MSFWEHQRKARQRTRRYIIFFALLTLSMAALLEYVMRIAAPESYHPPSPILAIGFILVTCIVAGFHYSMYQSYGGSYVAKSLGGRLVDPDTMHPQERQLLHVVEEMAVASRMPVPPVFILDVKQINAFAAGLKPQKAAVAVTQGTLDLLTREELQGVIGHEFGHISNGDMRINMQLAAMIMGFTFILYTGLRILQFSSYSGRSRSNQKGGNPIAIAALLLLLAGAFTWFGGAILRSMVSRQREFLADASAVQFTRNPRGIAGALRKIADYHNPPPMPATGMAFAHMYFDNHSFWSTLFATHPPVEKRIKAIESQ